MKEGLHYPKSSSKEKDVDRNKEKLGWIRDPKYLPGMNDLKKLFKTDWQMWDDFVYHRPPPVGTEFQILTYEFIESFGNHLLEIINKLNKEKIVILEVGAGNGRLSYFLEEFFRNKTDKNIQVCATDNLSWNDTFNGSIYTDIRPPFENVENMDYKTAIDKKNPDIIISSWMPNKTDWSKDFRESSAVVYILIGDPDSCGDKEVWREYKGWQGKVLNLKGMISWADLNPNIEKSCSVAVEFKRVSDS